MKKTAAALIALALSACHHVPLDGSPYLNNLQARDATMVAPNFQFQETAQSRSVIVGSQVYATANACQMIKRYRVVTNSDFTGSLNLMKYRAALMGAKWITIVQHRELDRFENAVHLSNEQVVYRDGIDLGTSRYLTTLVADLYDCPCTVSGCTAR